MPGRAAGTEESQEERTERRKGQEEWGIGRERKERKAEWEEEGVQLCFPSLATIYTADSLRIGPGALEKVCSSRGPGFHFQHPCGDTTISNSSPGS